MSGARPCCADPSRGRVTTSAKGKPRRRGCAVGHWRCLEMAGIPAATIAGVDLDAVARRDPAAAREIARIGELLRFGRETDAEFLTLIRLLWAAGEGTNAE